MAEKSFNQLKDEVIRNNGFYVNLYFDIHGNSKEALKNILVGFVGKITQEEGVRFGVGEIEEPIENQDLFSATAKVSLLSEDFGTLVKICSTYAPIGVEIEEPLDIKIPVNEVQQALLYVSGITQQFTKIILEKTMSAEEKQAHQKKIMQRAELGKKLVEKKGQSG